MSIKIPWQIWVCAGFILYSVALGWFFHHKGAAAVQKKWDMAVVLGTLIVNDLRAGQGKITTVTEVKYLDRIKVIHEKGETITKLIPQFIPNGSCDLPGGFRVLHDAAVTSTIPTAAEGTNAAAVSIEDTATTVIGNYTQCNGAISDLQGLREWVSQQEQLYLDQCKQQGVVCSKGN